MGDVQSTFIINKKEYISLKHVGKGSFGTVNLVKDGDGDGSKFILKTVLNDNSENEVRLMKLLSYYPRCIKVAYHIQMGSISLPDTKVSTMTYMVR